MGEDVRRTDENAGREVGEVADEGVKHFGEGRAGENRPRLGVAEDVENLAGLEARVHWNGRDADAGKGEVDFLPLRAIVEHDRHIVLTGAETEVAQNGGKADYTVLEGGVGTGDPLATLVKTLCRTIGESLGRCVKKIANSHIAIIYSKFCADSSCVWRRLLMCNI